MKGYILAALLLTLVFSIGCSAPTQPIDRESKIPSDAVKMAPSTDVMPPILHSDRFEKPVPFDAVNTAGAEDSPFVPYDSDVMYVFYTPDVRVPVEKQVIDQVTGIYYLDSLSGGKVSRVMLQKKGKLSLDGCEFVSGDKILFCAAREGYTGINWFSADRKDGVWGNFQKVDFEASYEVGELHIYNDELYFHSPRAGGKGQYDIYVSKMTESGWGEPKAIDIANTAENEGWPYITKDGKELWFTRFYQGSPAIFVSKRTDDNGDWGEPELIVSQFAGEPTMDSAGNLYFTHHYYKDGKMIEADIYVAKKK